MKNAKTIKLMLSGLVLLMAIFVNVNHCYKNKKQVSLLLNDLTSISTCHAEKNEYSEEYHPIIYSPYNPDEDISEEEEELMRRRRR